MTEQPRPAPVKPQPITDDPKIGAYRVVVAFWGRDPQVSEEDVWEQARFFAEDCFGWIADLDVGISVHGACGEASEHEGTVGLP